VPGQFVISLDFELHWGVRDHKSVDDYRENLLGVREAIPALLARFRQREIHATWATVGILFAKNREEALASAPKRRPQYSNRSLDAYAELESAGADEDADPFHFASRLVDRISATPNQELASHTYSHFYCLEPGPALAAFEDDLAAARSIGAAYGDVTRSIVFPRNQYDEVHLDVLRRHGSVAFRGNPPAWFWQPSPGAAETAPRRAMRLLDAYVPTGPIHVAHVRRHPSRLVDVPATSFLRPWSPKFANLEAIKAARLKAEMTAAARAGGLFHLWWHPHNFGKYLEENVRMLDGVLDTFEQLRRSEGMQSLTMAEAAQTAIAQA
jgi:peptidoglycan/xylan/chitin deacetylase (PgdA/CDA1 family)